MIDKLFSGSNAITFAVLCAALVVIMFWIIKRLFEMLRNDLAHIKKKIDDLPCQTDCPVEEDG